MSTYYAEMKGYGHMIPGIYTEQDVITETEAVKSHLKLLFLTKTSA